MDAIVENERGRLDAEKKAAERNQGTGNGEQAKPVRAPVAALAPVAAPTPAAPAAVDKKAEGPSLIDQLGDESKAK